MRCFFRIVITVAVCGPLFCQDRVPGWFSDAKGFCRELADRANGKGTPVPPAKPNSVRFTDYASRSVPPQRSQEAIIGKDEANNDEMFAQAVKLAASSGPDFAGRYAIVRWTCGTWCSNAVIADVISGKSYETPFLGVIGCKETNGSSDTIERRVNSSLLVVRGSLEMTFDQSFSEGPCGVFYFRWQSNRLHLIGCDIK